MILLWHDTKEEDEDTYRFLAENPLIVQHGRGALTIVAMDMSSHLMGNQFDPDSGLFLYSNAAVAKSVDAPVLETGGSSLAETRPVGVRIPSAAPHLFLCWRARPHMSSSNIRTCPNQDRDFR